MVGRGNTSAFDTEIVTDTIAPRILVDAEFTGGTVYVWNGIGDISYGGNTYTGAGNLLSISDINESTEIRIESMTIEFEGITTTYKSLALSSVDLKNQVTVRLGVLDSNGAVIADPDVVFIGSMDEVTLTEEGSTATFILEVQNELVHTQKVKERRYTDYDQQALYPGDTIMRHVVNSEKKTRWGSGI
jgi:hypothetical protein